MLVDTALTGQKEVPTGGSKGIPSTWVPQRNSIMLALAFAYAETVGADMVWTGFNIVDYSGYPDCRPDFVSAMERSLNLASKRYREEGHGIGIITPLIRKSKAQIILLGQTLKVPWELTWSCYSGREKACGKCDSCLIRLGGFQEAGIKDPIEYEVSNG
jgi:7-cyano-7-deazaguanine synthase